jgi:hypothetical protein
MMTSDSLIFGVVYYDTPDLTRSPERILEPLSVVQRLAGERRFSFQGLFSGRDQWSRLARASPKTLERLVTDLRASVFTHVVAYVGERDAETITMSFDSTRTIADDRALWSMSLIASERMIGEPDRSESLSLELWQLLSPSYGVSLFGEDWRDVNAELTGIPYSMWGITIDRANEERLLRLQRVRPSLGTYARNASWGNFLSADMVQRLGGGDRVREQSPAYKVKSLGDGGMYLRASEKPAVLHAEGYSSAMKPLSTFLSPIIAPGL